MKKNIISFSILLLFLFESNLDSQWVQIPSGMYSFKINALITNGNNIFAGTDNYGIFYSSNNGSNWNHVDYTYGSTTAFASNSSYMFEGRIDSGVYRSTNNGLFWSTTPLNVGHTIYALAANGNYVYAGGNGSYIFVSTNNGLNWIQNSLACYDIYSLAVKDNYVFAGAQDSGIFVSTNNGLNWTMFVSQLWGKTVYALDVNGNYIFAGTYNSGVYSTTNNGTNWVQTSLNNQTVYSLAVSGNILFAGTKWNGVYISTDNGTTWMYRGEGLNYNKYIYSLCVFNNYVFAGTDSCLFRRPLSEFTSTPSPPVLLSPPNNAVNLPLTDTLRWNASGGATSYKVQLSTDSTFNTNLIVNDSTVTVTYKIVSGLNILSKYYWRVNAKNPFGTSSYSQVWNFTTGGVPPAPVLLSPPSNSVVLPVIDTLRWNASGGAASYRVQVSTDSTFNTNIIVNDSTVTVTYKIVSGLNYLIKYYWRVNAKNSIGTSGYSPIWNFSILSPLGLITPSNHSTLYTPYVLFSWDYISIATSYEIQLSLDSTFNSGVHDTVSTLDSIIILFTGNVSNDHWRVRGHNAGGYGAWSTVWEFSVNLNGIKLNSSVIPKVYKLYNNYPNPFNPTTIIEFDLPNESNVRLIVYDISGKEVEILVNQDLKAGNYNIDFDGTNLASGIYFYRLVTDKFTSTKKMVLLK